MVRLFESLPGWTLQLLHTVASWAAQNPLTFILVGLLVTCTLWLNLLLMVQRKTRQRDAARAADRSKPGSFPGENR